MQPKSTMPPAEVTILPLRARAADQGDGQSAVSTQLPDPLVTQGAAGEAFQADRAFHAMLARFTDSFGQRASAQQTAYRFDTPPAA